MQPARGKRVHFRKHSTTVSGVMTSCVIHVALVYCTLSSQGAPPSSVSGGGSVAEGGVMTVTCVARGAKPAAYIYWNSEPELNLTNTVEEVNKRQKETTARAAWP